MLDAGLSIENVSALLGHASTKVTEKHYSPWVKTRQDALEGEVLRALKSVATTKRLQFLIAISATRINIDDWMEARVGIEPSRPIANTKVIDFNYSSFGNIWEILKQIGGSCIKMSNLHWWYSRLLLTVLSVTVRTFIYDSDCGQRQAVCGSRRRPS
jgi:hypothetical protein